MYVNYWLIIDQQPVSSEPLINLYRGLFPYNHALSHYDSLYTSSLMKVRSSVAEWSKASSPQDYLPLTARVVGSSPARSENFM